MSKVTVIDHPMIQHKLTIMRKKETGSKDFRELLKEISLLMGYEVTRDLPLDDIEIETPICKTMAKKVSGRKLAIVPILRAGETEYPLRQSRASAPLSGQCPWQTMDYHRTCQCCRRILSRWGGASRPCSPGK